MALYSVLSAPNQAMLAQSSAFSAISDNIANMRTGGFKTTDVRFRTVLANRFFENSDVGGVMPFTFHNIDKQGALNSTDNPLNLAISGKGLFVVNSQNDGSGETLFTRDGNFELKNFETEEISGFVRENGDIDTISATGDNPITFTADKAFLADKNGNFVQGFLADEEGNIDDSTTIAMRVDQFAFVSDASPTTTATLINTLPATATTGDVERAKASIFDSNGDLKSLEFVWTKDVTAQQWTLSITPDAGTSTSTDTFDFRSDGGLPNPTTSTINVTWDDGQTSDVIVDLSLTRSIGSTFFYSEFQKNGRSPGDLQDFSFDHNGNVNGRFSNGFTRPLYKIPVATFANPNKLDIRQGNAFATSAESGEPLLREVDKTGVAQFVPFFNEISNVDISKEFQTMILVQQAYNTAATVFKTVDEMTAVAADLKS